MKIIFKFLVLIISLIGNFSCQANLTNCVAFGKSSCDNKGDYRDTSNNNLSNDGIKANNGNANSRTTTRDAYLVGHSSKNQINIYSEPSESSYSPHYGLAGDEVKILSQYSNSNRHWYYVKFPKSGAYGWVQNEFIQLGS